MGSSAYEVFLRLRSIGEDGAHGRASLHLRAVAAGGYAFLPSAAADGAELFAEHGFGTVRAAALTVDVLGQNRRVIQFSL